MPSPITTFWNRLNGPLKIGLSFALAGILLTIIGVAVLLTPVLIRTWRDFNRKAV